MLYVRLESKVLNSKCGMYESRVSFRGGGGGGGGGGALNDTQSYSCIQSYSCLPPLPHRTMIPPPPPLERFSKRNTASLTCRALEWREQLSFGRRETCLSQTSGEREYRSLHSDEV